MKLINKDAVVAKIKGLIRANELYLSEPKNNEVRFQKVGAYSVLNDLLHFLDTLEVKEVDSEYVRKDVFIEKAVGWIDYQNRDGGCNFRGWEEDFRKEMEETKEWEKDFR